jgi:hypothetical protein
MTRFWWIVSTLVFIFLLFASVQAIHAQTIVVGDSIAFGTGHAMGVRTYARVGAGSCEIARYKFPAADTIVVSAGINDAPGQCVRKLYARFGHARVVVILPKGINSARAHVAAVAAAYGYTTISYRTVGRSFHPRSYPELAAAIWGRLGARQ